MRDQCGPLFKAARKELIRDGIVEKPQSDESLAHEVDAELIDIIEQKLPYEELIAKLHELMEKAMRIKHGMIRQKRVKNIKAELAKAKKSSSKSGEKSESANNSPVKAAAMSAATVSTPKIPSKRPFSLTDTSQSDDQDETDKRERAQPLLTTPTCSPIKSVNNSASPSGVNRRTAVLFTRKAKAAASLKKPETTPVNDENRASTEQSFQLKQSPTALASLQTSTPTASSAATTSDNVKKSPKKLSRSGRNNSLTSEPGTSGSLSAFDGKMNNSPTSTLAIASTSGSASMNSFQKKISPLKERYVPANTMPDSFRTYRGRGMTQSSDSEDSNMSCVHSECSSCSGSEFG